MTRSSIALAGAAVLASLGSSAARPATLLKSRASSSAPVIAQLFEWNWDSVTAECPTLGSSGFTYVQVSPPAEHITGGQWWTSYQRVSSQLVSKRGNRDQFANMIQACNNAGVQVLVDVVVNHMTAGSGTGIGGTPYSQYNYQGIYSGFDFHYSDQCGTNDDGIQDWSNKTQIQFCQLVGLADLKTESSYVRSTLVNHLNDILSLGAAGFRIDAAKHVPVSDLQAVIGGLSRAPYVTSEVVGSGAPIPPNDYAPLGTVTITQSYTALLNAFTGSAGLTSLNGWEKGQGIKSVSASVFVATHDSERNNGVGPSLVASSPNNAYALASVFLLAYPFGTPTVLSSYQFGNADDGAPNGGAGTCSGSGGANGFNCQHRYPAVVGMVKFRAAVGSVSQSPMVNWQTGSSQQIAFGRGSAGFVAINNGDSAWSATLTTQLPAGTYCDVVSGGVSNGACTGSSAVVSGGSIKLTVPARGALAFYVGATGIGSGSSGGGSTSPSARAIHPAAFGGKCLDVQNNNLADGSLIQLWDCGGTQNQQFVFASNGQGTAIKVQGTNFCLDAGSAPSNGQKLKIWTCFDGIAAQTWSFNNGGQISNQGQCVDMTDGSSANGNVLQTWQCSNGNGNQNWSA